MSNLISKIPSIAPSVLPNRSSVTLAECLAAGLHLGHSPKVWNPAMNPYLYGIRQGIHIINLDHTLYALRRAAFFTEQVALRGGKIVFLGSRRFLHPLVVSAALNAKAYFLTAWKGGLLTNKERILKRSVGFDPDKVSQALNEEDGQTKRNRNGKKKQYSNAENTREAKLENRKKISQPTVYSPDLVIILDYPNNLWAVKECNYYGIPVIALCDTDSNPTLIQYPIPGNDDSPAGVELIAQVLAESSRKGFLARESRANE